MSDAYYGEGYIFVGVGGIMKPLYLPLNFIINIKLL